MKKKGRPTTSELDKLRTKCWMSCLMRQLNSPDPSTTAAWLKSYLLPAETRQDEEKLESLKRNFRNWAKGRVDINKSMYTLGSVSQAVAIELKNPKVKYELKEMYRFGPSSIFTAFSDVQGFLAIDHAIELGMATNFNNDPMDACRHVCQSDRSPLIKLASCISLISSKHVDPQTPANYILPLLAEAFAAVAKKGKCHGITAVDLLSCLFDELDRQDHRFIETAMLTAYIKGGGFEGMVKYTYEPFALITIYDRGDSSTKILAGNLLRKFFDSSKKNPELDVKPTPDDFTQFCATEWRKDDAGY